MPRFLHTADWQIGRQYSRFDMEDGAILADARFTAIERLAALANDQQVDAILGAGDIFDAQTVTERTLRRCFQAMAVYAGPWILIPGNHDAALAESVWTRARHMDAIPTNVHVLTQPEPVVFVTLGFAVLPAPLTQRQTYQDLTNWFDTAETADGLLRIGLAHGSVTGQLAATADSPNPIAVDRAVTARLDYLALGDWHGCKQIDAHTWYSGTPEPDRFRNNDAGRALIVDVPTPGVLPEVAVHEVGQYRWFQWQQDLSVATDLAELLSELEQLPAQSVVDLTLTGQLDLSGHERLQQALGAAAGRHRSLHCETSGLRLQPTDEDIAGLHADGYVGDAIAELRELQDGGSDSGQARAQTSASEALAILADLLRAHGTKEDA